MVRPAVQSDHAVCQTLQLISSVIKSSPGRPFLGVSSSGFFRSVPVSEQKTWVKVRVGKILGGRIPV